MRCRNRLQTHSHKPWCLRILKSRSLSRVSWFLPHCHHNFLPDGRIILCAFFYRLPLLLLHMPYVFPFDDLSPDAMETCCIASQRLQTFVSCASIGREGESNDDLGQNQYAAGVRDSRWETTPLHMAWWIAHPSILILSKAWTMIPASTKPIISAELFDRLEKQHIERNDCSTFRLNCVINFHHCVFCASGAQIVAVCGWCGKAIVQYSWWLKRCL